MPAFRSLQTHLECCDFARIRGFSRVISALQWLAILCFAPVWLGSTQGASNTPTTLPRVLILGDSISQDYTPVVREILKGEAEVIRPMLAEGGPENCEGTTRGVKELDRWLQLGNGRWDVIHFNFGLHDLKRVDPQTGQPSNRSEHPRQADVDLYEQKLKDIVTRLKRTRAKLIWASTTPVPAGGVKPHRDPEDVVRYNEVARHIMEEAGIAVDDLYSLALPRISAWQRPVNVHFQEVGTRHLGYQVADAIRGELYRKPRFRKASPNVVIILADDLGRGDLGCYGQGSKIPTPSLDRLAGQGLRFTDAHSPSAVCTPTRYGLMTGRYAWRSRLKSGVLWGYSPPLMEADRVTLGSWMTRQGYSTACIGKWHLGLGWPTRTPVEFGDQAKPTADVLQIDFRRPLSSGPHTLGFGYSHILPASLDMDPYLFVENGMVVGTTMGRVAGSISQRQGGNGFWRAGPIAAGFSHERCEPDLITRAEEFLARQSEGRPFFLYLPMTSPHDPWLPLGEFKGGTTVGARGDAVRQMDAMVGRVMEVLDRKGFTKDTLVIFSSDNGAHWLPGEVAKTGHAANGKLRGMKSDVWEGGHRVPMIVRWPGHVKGGTESGAVVGLQDWFATLADLLGEELPAKVAPDSESFATVLKGARKWQRSRPLVLQSIQGTFGVRMGSWKFIEGQGSGGWSEGKVREDSQLYDLSVDLGERENLAGRDPKRVRSFRDALHEIRIFEGRESQGRVDR